MMFSGLNQCFSTVDLAKKHPACRYILHISTRVLSEALQTCSNCRKEKHDVCICARRYIARNRNETKSSCTFKSSH